MIGLNLLNIMLFAQKSGLYLILKLTIGEAAMGFWLITSLVNGKLSIMPRNIFLRSRMPTVASKLSADRSRTFDFNN